MDAEITTATAGLLRELLEQPVEACTDQTLAHVIQELEEVARLAQAAQLRFIAEADLPGQQARAPTEPNTRGLRHPTSITDNALPTQRHRRAPRAPQQQPTHPIRSGIAPAFDIGPPPG